jgi:hypothetical protein
VPSVTESEPGPPTDETAAEPVPADGETPEQKRARVMARLAEIIRADPPQLSGSGPVTAGGFPALPSSAEEFDQEAAAELFAALSEFFEQRKRPGGADEPDEAQPGEE